MAKREGGYWKQEIKIFGMDLRQGFILEHGFYL